MCIKNIYMSKGFTRVLGIKQHLNSDINIQKEGDFKIK